MKATLLALLLSGPASAQNLRGTLSAPALPTRHGGTPTRPSLLDVWERFKLAAPGFLFLEKLEALPPIGIAIRMR